MTPKEKAKELVNRFYSGISKDGLSLTVYWTSAIGCALIAVEEIIDTFIPKTNPDFTCYEIEYWKEVGQEIEKL